MERDEEPVIFGREASSPAQHFAVNLEGVPRYFVPVVGSEVVGAGGGKGERCLHDAGHCVGIAGGEEAVAVQTGKAVGGDVAQGYPAARGHGLEKRD